MYTLRCFRVFQSKKTRYSRRKGAKTGAGGGPVGWGYRAPPLPLFLSPLTNRPLYAPMRPSTQLSSNCVRRCVRHSKYSAKTSESKASVMGEGVGQTLIAEHRPSNIEPPPTSVSHPPLLFFSFFVALAGIISVHISVSRWKHHVRCLM